MQQLPTRPKRLPVDKLTPSAARLLLALLTLGQGETYDDAVQRSGIRECLTFLTARKQLVEAGFILQSDGREYTTLWKQQEQQPEHTTGQPLATLPYIGLLKTTDAKQ